MSGTTQFDRKLATLTCSITEAALAFERRWTLAGLARVNPDIAERLKAQIELWRAASYTGTQGALQRQGEALVRGYRKAAEVMATSGAEDDAYLIGHDAASGLTIAIGNQMAAIDQIPEDAIWLTPDEVAGLLNGMEGFATLAAIKRKWPGAIASAPTARTGEVTL